MSIDLTRVNSIIVNKIIAERPFSIVFRRVDDSVIAAQTVRIERRGGSGVRIEGEKTEETRGDIIILGDTTLDIEIGDRFNLDTGELCSVSFIRPNRETHVQAEAKIMV